MYLIHLQETSLSRLIAAALSLSLVLFHLLLAVFVCVFHYVYFGEAWANNTNALFKRWKVLSVLKRFLWDYVNFFIFLFQRRLFELLAILIGVSGVGLVVFFCSKVSSFLTLTSLICCIFTVLFGAYIWDVRNSIFIEIIFYISID